MLDLRLICVGKLKEKFYLDAAAEYQKRLSTYCKLQIVELPEQRLPQSPSQAEIESALKKEADAIRGKLLPSRCMVALCVEGRELSSPALARWLRDQALTSDKGLTFLIGGSYGLDETLKRDAALRLSMSPMTFPHHLARVMLLEQLYRGFKINEGSTYHK